MSIRKSSKPELWLPPLAWAVQLGTNYALEPIVCQHGARVYFWAVSALAFSACAFGLWTAWTKWRELRTAPTGNPGTEDFKFLAISGMGLSALSGLVVVAQALPAILFQPCQ